MSRRYEDIWKLGNSHGTLLFVSLSASSKYDDKIPSHFKADPTFATYYRRGTQVILNL
jgi:hypothetical protein